MKSMIRVMKALSDPNRVKVLKMLEIRSLCVCEITAILGLAQPTVSKHLKVLVEAGLVESWKEGAWVNYRLPARPETRYAVEMLAQLPGWLNDDPLVREAMAQVAKVDRLRICAA
jgi:ArsR family transcriptional regulator, arsenate/arsenite/antimonite-responsive transcriptional repressor